MKKHLGFFLNLLAIGLFVPGILLPILSFNMDLVANVGASSMGTDLIAKELSIMATVAELWNENRYLVAILIFAFSVCIPIFKSTSMIVAYLKKGSLLERKLVGFVNAIGKWSMADVFVVAVFLVIMSTNHADTSAAHQISMFGFKLDLNISTETLSAVGLGFYFFTAYCLLSIAANQIYQSGVHTLSQEDNLQ